MPRSLNGEKHHETPKKNRGQQNPHKCNSMDLLSKATPKLVIIL